MLYTTYFKNMQYLPAYTIKIVVSIFPPREMKINNTSVFHALNLASDKDDFKNYKNNSISFEKYIENYIYKLENETMSATMIKNIVLAIKKGKDIALVCYEKDYLTCHRYYLAKYIKDKYNVEWKEL